MFASNDTDRKLYRQLNDTLQNQNKEYINIKNSKEYRIGSFVLRLIKTLKLKDIKRVRGYIRAIIWKKKRIKSNIKPENYRINKFNENDYFSNFKIAVYTCVFGNYDKLQDPIIQPDNIDYYVITDQIVPEDSIWKPLDYKDLCPNYYNDVQKNRFFKMHPNIILSEYKYSIYVDGNVKIISDLTPYVTLLGNYGLGFHWHNERRCAYDELKAIKLAHKAKDKDIINYENYLKKNEFPNNYGLLECNVIVRENNNAACKQIMENWRYEFYNNFQRDQVSLPYVLYKNGIKVKDLAVLGNDVYKNYSFRIEKHY